MTRKVLARVPYPIPAGFFGWNQVERIVECEVVGGTEKTVEVTFWCDDDLIRRIILKTDIIEELAPKESEGGAE